MSCLHVAKNFLCPAYFFLKQNFESKKLLVYNKNFQRTSKKQKKTLRVYEIFYPTRKQEFKALFIRGIKNFLCRAYFYFFKQKIELTMKNFQRT